jgi:hypothetical protein
MDRTKAGLGGMFGVIRSVEPLSTLKILSVSPSIIQSVGQSITLVVEATSVSET